MSTQKTTHPTKDDKYKPLCCPFCGSIRILEIVEWAAASTGEIDNSTLLTEYQCKGTCEGKSFWA